MIAGRRALRGTFVLLCLLSQLTLRVYSLQNLIIVWALSFTRYKTSRWETFHLTTVFLLLGKLWTRASKQAHNFPWQTHLSALPHWLTLPTSVRSNWLIWELYPPPCACAACSSLQSKAKIRFWIEGNSWKYSAGIIPYHTHHNVHNRDDSTFGKLYPAYMCSDFDKFTSSQRNKRRIVWCKTFRVQQFIFADRCLDSGGY